MLAHILLLDIFLIKLAAQFKNNFFTIFFLLAIFVLGLIFQEFLLGFVLQFESASENKR